MNVNRVAVIVATAILAGGAGAAVAATSGGEASEREQAVLNDAAGRLGTTAEKLRDALGAALDAQLDKAVEDGRLTQARADEIKRRRQESGRVLGGRGLHGGRGHHGPGGRRGAGLFADLADALGISERQLHRRLRAGRTVAQIARAQGRSPADVRRDLRAAVKARLDQAVSDGEITRSQAGDMLEHLDDRLDRLGSFPGGRGRFGGRRRHGGPPFPPPGG